LDLHLSGEKHETLAEFWLESFLEGDCLDDQAGYEWTVLKWFFCDRLWGCEMDYVAYDWA